MIFWITLIIFIILFILYLLSNAGKLNYNMNFFFSIVSVIFGVLMGVMLIIICISHTNINRKATLYEMEQLKSAYEESIDDFDHNILVAEIMEANKTIMVNKELNSSIWTGIFIPDFYDDIEFIELDKEN